MGQAQHGDQVHILTWERNTYDWYRVRVVETGLIGWVDEYKVVIP